MENISAITAKTAEFLEQKCMIAMQQNYMWYRSPEAQTTIVTTSTQALTLPALVAGSVSGIVELVRP
jgi:hypothetical protein